MSYCKKIVLLSLSILVLENENIYSNSFLLGNQSLGRQNIRNPSCHDVNHLIIRRRQPSLKTSKKDSADDREKGNAKSAIKKYRSGSLMAATKEQGRVPYGEESRKYRRTIYDYDDWIKHRSSERLAATLTGLFFSGIVRQLASKVGSVTIVATFVVLWNYFAIDPPSSSPFTVPSIHLPVAPFQLASPALGLLLVFRTNASYQRWLEARKAWGRIISQNRNMIRMACTFVEDTDPATYRSLQYMSLCMWLFSRSIMNKLSGSTDEVPYVDAIEKAFTMKPDIRLQDKGAFLSQLLSSPDRSIAALMELSLALNDTPIDEKRRVEIDKSLVIMADQLSECERIFTSPVPLVYTRHTARFLTLYVLMLPLALYDQFRATGNATLVSYFLVPASALISLFLFGIEELAVQLEEPFSILPMEEFCDKIYEASEIMIGWRFNKK